MTGRRELMNPTDPCKLIPVESVIGQIYNWIKKRLHESASSMNSCAILWYELTVEQGTGASMFLGSLHICRTHQKINGEIQKWQYLEEIKYNMIERSLREE